MLYNPTGEKITRTIRLPLYYTGLQQKAVVREKETNAKTYTLNRDYSINFTFTLLPESYSWYVIE